MSTIFRKKGEKIMAQKSSSSKQTKTTKSTGISLNKFSFWMIAAVAILYLVSMILSLVGINFRVVGALQGIATAIMICIVAVLAWRYVRHKQVVWIVLYVVLLLIVLVGVVVPLCV